MKKHMFYGWIVVAAGMGVMATAIGIINNCFGLLIIPVCEELGFTRQEIAVNQTLLNLSAMIIAMFSGIIFSRKNLKKLMCIGSVSMCVLYGMFSAADSLTSFYVIALLVGLAQGMVNVVPFSIIVNNWFFEKKGLALGMIYMGSGLGGMIFNILGGRWLEIFGWRTTVLIFDAVLCIVVLPLVFWVIQIAPSDMGLIPLGTESDELEEETKGTVELGQILHIPAFYIAGIEIMIAAMAVNGICATSAAYYTDVFSSGINGANMASGVMASLAAGKILLGILYDRFGTLRATFITRFLLLVSLFSMMQGSSTVFIILFLMCTGIACAANSVAIPFLSRDILGERGSMAVVGIYSGMQSLGALLAPVFCGGICDYAGNYVFSYQILLIAVLVMLFPIMKILMHSSKKHGTCS